MVLETSPAMGMPIGYAVQLVLHFPCMDAIALHKHLHDRLG